MNYKSYQEKKKEYDDQIYVYLAKRIFDDYCETDACMNDIIDDTGAIINNPTHRNDWSYTKLDNFITYLKQYIGKDNLRAFFKNYKNLHELDPLFIMTHGNSIDNNKVIDSLSKIITKMQDKSYLPEYLYHSDVNVEEDESKTFSEQASHALTLATYLLYAIRLDRTPSKVDFEHNIKPSVEITFNYRPCDDYNGICSYCEENKLTYSGKITSEGIRLVVEIATELVNSGLLSNDKSRVENQSANWIKLGSAYK